MKKIPILFSTEMVQAILEGRKTQTRRLAHVKVDSESGYVFVGKNAAIDIHNWETRILEYCKYDIGDLLWVKETFTIDERGGGDVGGAVAFHGAFGLAGLTGIFSQSAGSVGRVLTKD